MIKTIITVEFILFIIMTCAFTAHLIYMTALLKELEKEIKKLKDKNKEE
jgi:multisubunit Na+/H+ antiporter MnhG subunit